MTDSSQKNGESADLLIQLVAKKIISEAQAELVREKQRLTGMPADQVLSSHGWLRRTALTEHVAKRAQMEPTETTAQNFESALLRGSQDDNAAYNENLRRYRELMTQILGDDSQNGGVGGNGGAGNGAT